MTSRPSSCDSAVGVADTRFGLPFEVGSIHLHFSHCAVLKMCMTNQISDPLAKVFLFSFL